MKIRTKIKAGARDALPLAEQHNPRKARVAIKVKSKVRAGACDDGN